MISKTIRISRSLQGVLIRLGVWEYSFQFFRWRRYFWGEWRYNLTKNQNKFPCTKRFSLIFVEKPGMSFQITETIWILGYVLSELFFAYVSVRRHASKLLIRWQWATFEMFLKFWLDLLNWRNHQFLWELKSGMLFFSSCKAELVSSKFIRGMLTERNSDISAEKANLLRNTIWRRLLDYHFRGLNSIKGTINDL